MPVFSRTKRTPCIGLKCAKNPIQTVVARKYFRRGQNDISVTYIDCHSVVTLQSFFIFHFDHFVMASIN